MNLKKDKQNEKRNPLDASNALDNRWCPRSSETLCLGEIPKRFGHAFNQIGLSSWKMRSTIASPLPQARRRHSLCPPNALWRLCPPPPSLSNACFGHALKTHFQTHDKNPPSESSLLSWAFGRRRSVAAKSRVRASSFTITSFLYGGAVQTVTARGSPCEFCAFCCSSVFLKKYIVEKHDQKSSRN